MTSSTAAWFISEHSTRHLRVGGTLLVNPRHGDAAMASIDERFELAGVVISDAGDYRVDTSDLASYLIAKETQAMTAETLHESSRGVACTRSPFARLFDRLS